MNTILTPVERLALSRERLRLALAEDARQPESPIAALLTGGSGVMDVLKAVMPAAGEVLEALATRWEHTNLRPFLERNPLALVAGATVAGIAVAWVRPWRWLFRTPVLGTVGPALLTSVLASGHVQEWITMILSKITKPARAEAAHTTPFNPNASGVRFE